jgi:hypothetical protein
MWWVYTTDPNKYASDYDVWSDAFAYCILMIGGYGCPAFTPEGADPNQIQTIKNVTALLLLTWGSSMGAKANDHFATLAESQSSSPGFIVTANGDVIPIPQGATGPQLAQSGKGFMFSGGSGGNGLHTSVSGVRVMDPTNQYPGGYVNYLNSSNQPINPYNGQTVPRTSEWWHIIINLFGK